MAIDQLRAGAEVDLRSLARREGQAGNLALRPNVDASSASAGSGACVSSQPRGFETLPEPIPGACEWEIWHYSPALVRDGETVDPLSLTLSLQGSQDERVQLALDELKGRFPW